MPSPTTNPFADTPRYMNPYGVIIAGTGHCVPERRLTNDDLARMVDTNDEWIMQRTGIKERRIASESESTAKLAAGAARNAIEAAGLTAADIDLIIVATITPEMVTPSTANFVALDLGRSGITSFDISAACSGFLYALETGASLMKAGRYRHAVIIGADTLSRITDYSDRSSCILFGDGAGAVVLSRAPDAKAGEAVRGILHTSLHSDASGWELLYCAPGSRTPVTAKMLEEKGQYLKMKGRDIYKFAVSRFQELLEDAVKTCNLKPEDVSLVIPHQVNLRIIDSALEKIGLPRDRCIVNIDRYGNTSAASIPIALDEAWRAGRIRKGDVLVFVAFGAGLTWANAVVRV